MKANVILLVCAFVLIACLMSETRNLGVSLCMFVAEAAIAFYVLRKIMVN